MLDILVYPVSGVMKLWHLLLHNVFGMEDSTAWFFSILGLVFTIRAIIAPFSWTSFKSVRINSRLRPARAAISAEFEGRHDEEAIREMQRRNRELNREWGINPLAGCVPSLIQIPTVLGLYLALVRMARPEGGLENPVHAPVGFLSAAEVQSFLEGRINNVPLPAYVAMPAEQLSFLGTTREEVLSLLLPMLVVATILTALNSLNSVFRNYQTHDFTSAVSVRIYKMITPLTVIAPLFPLTFGLAGPVPTAIALYWVSNNLWTFVQTFIIYRILDRRYPYPEEFREHQAKHRSAFHGRELENLKFRWARRRNRMLMVLTPWRAADLHRENVRMTTERRERIEAEQRDRKELEARRKETQVQMNQESYARLRERREELKRARQQEKDTTGNTPYEGRHRRREEPEEAGPGESGEPAPE